MRDENGFKCHTQSESHVRQMLLVGEDPRKHIQDFSNQFQRDFLQLLRTSHGEKQVNMNHFYQEYIANKEHVHMNATRWPSLTEFAKYLGREGICRVEETDKGLQVSWIDNSPEALRRQDAIRRKERQDKGDEEREQRLIREQVERAKQDAVEKKTEDENGNGEDENDVKERRTMLQRDEGEKVKLDLNLTKSGGNKSTEAVREQGLSPVDDQLAATTDDKLTSLTTTTTTVPSVSLKAPNNGISKVKRNVFALATKKNGNKTATVQEREGPKRPMSEAERIMREELDRKARWQGRGDGSGGGGRGGQGPKRQRVQ